MMQGEGPRDNYYDGDQPRRRRMGRRGWSATSSSYRDARPSSTGLTSSRGRSESPMSLEITPGAPERTEAEMHDLRSKMYEAELLREQLEIQ